MFPFRGRLEADSKSNSSTLDPSRTTTGVSSGWLASISILFFMEFSGTRARPAFRRGTKGGVGWGYGETERLRLKAAWSGSHCIGHQNHLISGPHKRDEMLKGGPACRCLLGRP